MAVAASGGSETAFGTRGARASGEARQRDPVRRSLSCGAASSLFFFVCCYYCSNANVIWMELGGLGVWALLFGGVVLLSVWLAG